MFINLVYMYTIYILVYIHYIYNNIVCYGFV